MNLLFADRGDFSILDRSHGESGEPVDDVSALGVNYLFFGVRTADAAAAGGVAEPFATLFHVFLDNYLKAGIVLGKFASNADRIAPTF